MRRRSIWMHGSVAIAGFAAITFATPPVELATLAWSEAGAGDESGRSVAAAGAWIIVGAPGANVAGEVDQGAAWVFKRTGESTWVPEASLLDPLGASGDSFGLSVAIDDPALRGGAGEPVAIVGALQDDVAGKVDAGSASVFRLTDGVWIHEQTLIASDGLAGDEFGRSVAIRDDLVMVGAWDAGLFDQGAVYVFRRNAKGLWQQTQKLTAPGAATGDHLGTSLALDATGDRVIAGAWGDDSGASNGGSASVWRRQGEAFVFEQELVGSGLEAGDELGRGVAIDGDLVVVGGWSFWGDGRGTARVFRRSGTAWSEEAALGAPDGAPDDYFGFSVACRRSESPDGAGDLVACGAWADDVAGTTNQGSVWLFERSPSGTQGGLAWAEREHLVASDGSASDYFGFSLAFECELLVAGVRLDDVGSSTNAGSARVWWVIDQDGDGAAGDCGGGLGLPGDLDGDGVVGAADLAMLLSQWGGIGSGDLDGDGHVGAGDLALLLAAWSRG